MRGSARTEPGENLLRSNLRIGARFARSVFTSQPTL
jgi:hypothetical protein